MDSAKAVKLLMIAMTAFSLVVIMIVNIVSSYVSNAEREKFLKTALVCEGTVTHCYKATIKGRMVGYDMDMDYVVDGETHHAEDIRVKTDYSVGDKITVYYDPKNPTMFTIDKGEESQEYKMHHTYQNIAVTLLVLLFLAILWYKHKTSA